MSRFLGFFSLSVLLGTAPLSYSEPDFNVIGYLPSWEKSSEKMGFNGLTQVNYSFALPNADGSLKEIPEPDLLKSVVRRAHSKGIKVCLAIGGWNDGNDSDFEKLAAAPESRAKFVNACLAAMDKFELDGVDIDWEYPDAGKSSENFLSLIRELSVKMKEKKKLLSIAVVANGDTGDGIKSEVFPFIDALNIMAYDGKDHGLYKQAEESLLYWEKRGCPKSKLILGLPFYGRAPYLSYREILAKDPTASTRNELGKLRYNNPEMIEKKTLLAKGRAGGVMIWELTQDIEGTHSLLEAVNRASKK